MWRRAWVHVIPFFSFPPEVRRVIYTTNAIESVNSGLRKAVRARGHFPSDQAATKLIWLALRNITAKWERATRQWKEAMNQFAILYDDPLTGAYAVVFKDIATGAKTLAIRGTEGASDVIADIHLMVESRPG
jgi:hypothetical protein